jgi:hypothetical protein
MTCDECRNMLANPADTPLRMAERLRRSPLMQETKRSDGVMVSLWDCVCGQLWQRESFPDGKQFWLPQAEPAPPPSATSIRRPRF